MFRPRNLLAFRGVRPLRRGCCWRRLASSPSTSSSASAASSNHDDLHPHNQIDQIQYNKTNSCQRSRSEPQVTGRTGSDTICNNPPCYYNNPDNRCKFFCLKVCAHVEEGKPTPRLYVTTPRLLRHNHDNHDKRTHSDPTHKVLPPSAILN